MKRPFFYFTLCLGVALPPSISLPAADPPRPYAPALDAVREREIRAWIGFLASEELEGRATGTKGYAVASRFARALFEAAGIEGGAPGGGYFQDFVLVRRSRPLDEARLALRSSDGREEALELKGEIAVSAPGPLEWEGEWVFAGRGEGANRDAPDDYHGLELEGRVLLVLPRGDPEREGLFETARLHGVKRLVVVSDEAVRRRLGLRFRLVAQDLVREPAHGLEVLYVSRKLAGRILERWGRKIEEIEREDRPRPFHLDGVRFRLSVPLRVEKIEGRNVVARIEGSDPSLRHETVLIGAHLDHVGFQRGVLHPGADDNASGSAAVLAAAKAFAAAPHRPRRTVYFVLFGGEELGLHGSGYFVRHAPYPVDRTVLMINLDMVGRDEERKGKRPEESESAGENRKTLHLVGVDRISRELKPWILRVNGLTGFEFEYDEERVFTRSDQYHFAARRIPVVFFFAGFHPDYHRPGDTADKINFTKVVNVAKLAFALAYEVADRPRRLARNRF